MSELKSKYGVQSGIVKVLKNRLLYCRGYDVKINDKTKNCLFFSTFCENVPDLLKGEHMYWPYSENAPVIISDRKTIDSMPDGLRIPFFEKGSLVEVHITDPNYQNELQKMIICCACGSKGSSISCGHCSLVCYCSIQCRDTMSDDPLLNHDCIRNRKEMVADAYNHIESVDERRKVIPKKRLNLK